ncbi:response regulator [Ideonella sp. 4Y11]|uniref:histidine kinase n=1 Tax=Ideonella aquatica TaxID=2824119 RepID=A0A940YR13_9BURK|nr:hybrid sensor histidine kinase/response regulator [Ideonella aquatica]MBQ0960413.1 response regulator [Ideonella aquatica]
MRFLLETEAWGMGMQVADVAEADRHLQVMQSDPLAQTPGLPRVILLLSQAIRQMLLAGEAGKAVEALNEVLPQTKSDTMRALVLAAKAQSGVVSTVTGPSARNADRASLAEAMNLLPPDTYPYFGIQGLMLRAQLNQMDQAFAAALADYQRALALAEQQQSAYWANVLRSMIAIDANLLGDYRLTVDTVQRMDLNQFSVAEQLATHMAWAVALAELGDRSALVHLQQAQKLGQQVDMVGQNFNLHTDAARIYHALGDDKQAYLSMRETEKLRTERQRAANEKLRQDAQARFDVQKKEQENALLKEEQKRLDERRQLVTIGLVVALVVAGVILLLLAVQLRQKRQLARLSQTLQARNAELDGLNQSRTLMIAAACHDLRQPAHALGMLADLMAAEDDPARRQQWLHNIRRSSATLSDMLSMLMDLGQLEGGRYEPVLSSFDLAEVVEDVRLQYGELARRKGLRLELPEGVSARVHADLHLTRRVLFNLVSNAIKYTPAGHVKVGIEPQAQGVELSVEDSGVGIPPHQQEDIFRPYVRVDEAGQSSGLGIGLSIVRRAADLLHWPLALRSEPGQGTRISLTLPAAAPSEQSASAAQRALPTGRTLALIEDDEVSRGAMAALLRSWGVKVIDAPSSAELLPQLAGAGAEVDLVLSDLHLEDESGLDNVARVRGTLHKPELKAMLVTGDLSSEVAQVAEQQRITLVHKPLSPTRLRSLLAEALT